MNMISWAAAGTGFTFLMTALGASLVLFFKKQPRKLRSAFFSVLQLA